MRKRIEALRDHFILCGYGRVDAWWWTSTGARASG